LLSRGGRGESALKPRGARDGARRAHQAVTDDAYGRQLFRSDGRRSILGPTARPRLADWAHVAGTARTRAWSSRARGLRTRAISTATADCSSQGTDKGQFRLNLATGIEPSRCVERSATGNGQHARLGRLRFTTSNTEKRRARRTHALAAAHAGAFA
jgi:hypothetical protein